VIGASKTADRLEAALPWKLTGAQIRALSEVRGDLQSGERMSRLLQGDVGAGKTIVAMLAMADAAEAHLQSVLMAPTEILARQHFETIAAPLEAQGPARRAADRPRQGRGADREADGPDGRHGQRRRRHPRPVPGRCDASAPSA
jgi:superfamily II DNA or RNA helicase